MKTKSLFVLIFTIGISLSGVALSQDANTDRLLESGDVLYFMVWGYPPIESSRIPIIGGKANLPLIGKVQAEGLTLDEFRCIAQGRLSKHMSNATVFVEFYPPKAGYRNGCRNIWATSVK